ncbi:MAG: hypothetical protein ACLFRU_00185 [Paracoccaceae bacterium]
MTNSIAIMLGLAIIGALAADQVWNDGLALIFLMKKFFAMLEWLAFWR